MKSFRLTLVFFVIVAGLASFAVWDYKHSLVQEETKQSESKLIKAMPDDVTRVEINAKTSRIELEKKADGWQLTGRTDAGSAVNSPADEVKDSGDSTTISAFLTSVTTEKSKEVVAEGNDIQWGVYGLDKPVSSIKITAKNGVAEALKIGSVKAYDGNLYARVNEDPRVLLVASSWDVHLSKPVREFRDKRLFRLPTPPQFTSLRISSSASNSSTKSEVVELEKESGHWRFKSEAVRKASLPVSDTNVQSYIDQLVAVKAVDFVSGTEGVKFSAEAGKREGKGTPDTSTQILEKNGLKNPAVLVRLQAGQSAPIRIAFSSEKAAEANVSAVSSDVSSVVTVYKSVMESARRSNESFFDRNLPFQFPLKDVAAIRIDVKAESSTKDVPPISIDAIKEGDKWVNRDKTIPREIDSAKLEEMLGRLAKLDASRFLRVAVKGSKPGSTGKTADQHSHITLLNAAGTTVFELAWEAPTADKTKSQTPKTAKPSGAEYGGTGGDGINDSANSKYIPAKTNLVNWDLGLAESSVSSLGISAIIKEKEVVPKAEPKVDGKPVTAPAAAPSAGKK